MKHTNKYKVDNFRKRNTAIVRQNHIGCCKQSILNVRSLHITPYLSLLKDDEHVVYCNSYLHKYSIAAIDWSGTGDSVHCDGVQHDDDHTPQLFVVALKMKRIKSLIDSLLYSGR